VGDFDIYFQQSTKTGEDMLFFLNEHTNPDISFNLIIEVANVEVNSRQLMLIDLMALAEKNNLNIKVTPNQAVQNKNFSKLETQWLAELKRLGFLSNILPDVTYGMYASQVSNQIVLSGPPTTETLRYINNEIIIKTTPTFDCTDSINSKHLPCFACKILPVCGGSSIEAWKTIGDKICPSYLFNLKERLLLSL
jgi:hypothetical protein